MPDPITSSFSPSASYIPEAENQCLPSAIDEPARICVAPLPTPLGRWTPQNQCQTFAEALLIACTRRSTLNDGAEGAPGY
jgi:hypothetical protein